MTYKPTMTMDKAWSHVELPTISFAGIFAKLKSAVNARIPVGYQDETGFHTGRQPENDSVEFPSSW